MGGFALLLSGLLGWALWLYEPVRPPVVYGERTFPPEDAHIAEATPTRSETPVEVATAPRKPSAAPTAKAVQSPPRPAPTPQAQALEDPERSDQPVAEEVDPILAADERRAERREENRAGFPVAAERFASEGRDPAWAEGHERALQEALAGDDQVGGEVHSIECHSTLCEVKVRLNLGNPMTNLERISALKRALGTEAYFGGAPADPKAEAPGETIIYTTAQPPEAPSE